jgi:hypothetical protein
MQRPSGRRVAEKGAGFYPLDSLIIGRLNRKKASTLFFEKKNQKTFIHGWRHPVQSANTYAARNRQRFCLLADIAMVGL